MRPLLFASVLAASFPALTGTAGAAEWVSLGPFGERSARQVEIDAAGPANLYALHELGVLRSGDGGTTWELGGEGLRGGLRPVDLLADPHRPGALYLTVFGIGVFRSPDGGAHWRPAANRGLPEVVKPGPLEAHPTRPSTLYLATSSHWIFVSEDRGDSWRAAGTAELPSHHIVDLAVDPDHPDTLYAVGTDETRSHDLPIAFKSEDGGASWQSHEIRTALGFAPHTTAVVVTPGGPGAVCVASRGGGIVRSSDGGATWARADAGLPVDDEGEGISVVALAAHPTDPSILYASTGDRGTAPGVFRTTDGGETWEPVGEWPAGAPPAADLALHPDDPSLLFASPGPYLSPLDADGPWRSRQPILPLRSRFVTPHPHDPETLFTGLLNDLQRSRDGGATWESFATSLPRTPGFEPGGLVVDPADPDTMYLLAKNLYKSEDGGLTWVERDQGLHETNGVAELAISAAGSEVLYAWNGFFLYRSTDGAETWAPLFDGGENVSVSALALHPTDPEVLYLGTAGLAREESGGGVCRSTDGGGFWTCLALSPSKGGVRSLVVDPADPRRLYLTWNESGAPFGEVWRSADGGDTWSPASDGLPKVPIVDLAIASREGPATSPSTVWAATDGQGVYRSSDGGTSWLPVAPAGMAPLAVRDLSVGPRGLYAATLVGVFRLDAGPGAGQPLPPDGIPWLEDAAFPEFRFKVRIDQGARTLPGTREPRCVEETVCVSGAVPGRSELFLRLVGPKPNGRLWPTLVKFSTSRIEVWIQQLSTGELRYYELRGASPGFDELPGLFDRFGFQPQL